MGNSLNARCGNGVSARSAAIFVLDTLLLVAFILLLSPRMTGLPMHELIGAAFIVPVLLHLVIARPWVRGAVRNVVRTSHTRTRINLVLNALLFILVVSEIFSGLEISQVLLPSMGWLRLNDRAWRQLHNELLNWLHLLVGVHIAVNWSWIVASFRRLSAVASRRVTFAPTHFSAFVWAGVILAAASLEMLAIYSALGHPTIARFYPQNEIARFRPTAGHGIGQFVGESMLTAAVAYAARRWFRVRI